MSAMYTGPRAVTDSIEQSDSGDFEFIEIEGVVSDVRELTHGRNSVVEQDLESIIPIERFRGGRVVEIGPKFGDHSRWIDSRLDPALLVLSELPQKRGFIQEWIEEIRCPREVVYGSMIGDDRLLRLGPFDVVFCTGVLYHTAEHLKVLRTLRRLLASDGLLIFQSTIDPSPEAIIRIAWEEPGQIGKYAYPSLEALKRMLQMTGFGRVVRYASYRPGAGVVLMTCEPGREPVPGYDGVVFGESRV